MLEEQALNQLSQNIGLLNEHLGRFMEDMQKENEKAYEIAIYNRRTIEMLDGFNEEFGTNISRLDQVNRESADDNYGMSRLIGDLPYKISDALNDINVHATGGTSDGMREEDVRALVDGMRRLEQSMNIMIDRLYRI